MGTFNGFHVEVAMSLVLEDGGVAGICQGAGVARAQASQIVFIPAESLRLSRSNQSQSQDES